MRARSDPGPRPWARLLLMVLIVVLAAACEEASELQPVTGRLSHLQGEGPPPGYIGGDIPPEYLGVRNPFRLDDPEALSGGSLVYFTVAGDLSCVSCHGQAGRGDGPRALRMDPGPPDFAAPPMRNAFRNHQDYVFWWVSEGVAKTVMPAYQDVLTEAQRWQVITFAWQLSEQGGQAASESANADR